MSHPRIIAYSYHVDTMTDVGRVAVSANGILFVSAEEAQIYSKGFPRINIPTISVLVFHPLIIEQFWHHEFVSTHREG